MAIHKDQARPSCRLCGHGESIATSNDSIEVGGLVRFPGVMPIPDNGLDLAQVLIRSGGVDPMVRLKSPYSLFVAVRRIAEGEPVTTYFPLPLVEQGLAGSVHVAAESRVTVVERGDTAVDPSYTQRAQIVALSERDAEVRIHGFRIGSTVATIGQLLDTVESDQQESQRQIRGRALRGAMVLAKSRFRQSNPEAGVAVITRRSFEGLGIERFVLLLDEPLSRDGALALGEGRERLIAAEGSPLPQIAAEVIAQQTNDPPGPRRTNRPAPSPRAEGIVDEQLIAEVLGVPAAANAAPEPRSTVPPTAARQEIGALATFADRVALLHGDDVELVPLPLVAEVLSGVVRNRTKARVAERLGPMKRMREEHEAIREAQQSEHGDSWFHTYTEPVTRVAENVGESTRRVAGLLMP